MVFHLFPQISIPLKNFREMLKSQLQKSKPKPMKDIMKFRRSAKPPAYPLRYVEDFGAKDDFIRTSSLKGCGLIGCMLHISARGHVFSKLRSFTEPVRKDSRNDVVQ